MSRLNDLINEMCPDDVEYKSINEIADTNIGLATSVTANKADTGIQLLHNSDIQQNRIVVKKFEYITESFANRNKSKIFQYHDIITVHTGDVGTSAVIEEEYVGSIGFTTITTRIRDFNEVDPYYLSYYLNSSKCKQDVYKFTISDRNNLNQKAYEQLIVPIPPLEVQREIVRVLDYFSLLTEELTEELTARRKQYEFYRDYLVNSEKEAPTVSVTEICDDIFLGLTSKVDYVREGGVPLIRANNMTSGHLTLNDVRYISREQHEKLTRNHKAKKGDILISKSGTLGVVCIVDIDMEFSIYESLICLHPNKKIYNRFLLHLLRSKEIQDAMLEKKVGNAIKHLNLQTFRKLYVRIPPIEKQYMIADVLDRLDYICNNMDDGIPAEIEARKKQYEYYRDKLLSFKELGA